MLAISEATDIDKTTEEEMADRRSRRECAFSPILFRSQVEEEDPQKRLRKSSKGTEVL